MSSAHPTGVLGASPTPDLLHLLDARGRRRSPAATPGFKPPRPPATKGRTYDPDPLPVEDVVKILEACTPQRPGSIGALSAARLRAMVVVFWRTGLRMMELLDLEERDLERSRLMIVVRRGKGRQAPHGRHGPVGLTCGTTASTCSRSNSSSATRTSESHRPTCAGSASSRSSARSGSASHR